MKFERRYTVDAKPIVDQIDWEVREASIPGAGFHMSTVEVPKSWSQDATNILAQKYLRKAGVPSQTKIVSELGVPDWLSRSEPDQIGPFSPTFTQENSAQQVFHRMVGCWTYWGWLGGYFGSDEESARVFYDELYWMLANQVGAPNSPQWFNTGLHWAYGIEGPNTELWAIDYLSEDPMADPMTKFAHIKNYPTTIKVPNTYERPQVHACFLTPTIDDLVNPGGIMDTWAREARIFKLGSGSGINVSAWRGKGESLSGGGLASGVMSFLRIGDSAAGAIQSGGTTRRAAKMVCMDVDHPEVEEFIDWKVREESKAAAMYVGSQLLKLMPPNPEPIAIPEAVIDRIDNGFEPEVFDIGWEGEAIRTVDGQNSNNSVRVTDEFMECVENDVLWDLTARTTDEVVKRLPAADLWSKICRAAWASADPGLLFHTTINAWNTCAVDGEIRTTNPCAEFHHLDGSACDLASLNLCKFVDERNTFDHASFEHACRLWTVVLDVSVSMAGFPAREFAQAALNYRTLGLGYANLGGLLARVNLRYDSDVGRAFAAGVTALMTGVAYRTSAEMAEDLGSFPRWNANKESMQRILQRHYDEFHAIIHDGTNEGMFNRTNQVWAAVSDKKPLRNAQVTLLAPTGTIALVMDCDTTGIEPFYSLSTVKNLAGGGTMTIQHYNVAEADCAVPSRPVGLCLSPLAHVLMVAAVQPFLSGGVSKTVNLPHDATVEDVATIYREAHKLGLKSVAIYRDNSKLTQPLEVAKNARDLQPVDDVPLRRGERRELPSHRPVPLRRGERRELPSHRPYADRVKLEVGGQSVYISTGDHEDGSLGEIFVALSREGSTVRSMMECFSKAVSIGLQYGVPLDVFVDAFVHTKFDPAGVVAGDTRVRICSSLPDLIVRHLAVEYLDREDLASVQPAKTAETVVQLAVRIARDLERTSHGAPKMTMVADVCWECGHGTLMRTGTCLTCVVCGANSGCG